MGSFWSKVGRVATGIYTGGLSEWLGAANNSGENRRARGAAYDQQMAEVADAQGNFILDEFGYTPQMPGRYVAREAQYASERFIAAKNARIRSDALNTLRGGLGLLESYRPGGAAAMTSPYYSQMANVLMASQLEAPDLLGELRQAQQSKANEAARKAQYAQIGAGVLTAAGAIFGGPAGAAVGAGIGQAVAGQAGQRAQDAQGNVEQPPQGTPGATGGPYGGFQAQGGGGGEQAGPAWGPDAGGEQGPPYVGPVMQTQVGGEVTGQAAGGQQQSRKAVGGSFQTPGAVAGGGAPGQQRGGGAGPQGRQQGGAPGAGGQAGAGPAGAPGGGGGGDVGSLVAMGAAATLNGPDFWSRELAALDELSLHVEAILYA